MKYEKPSMIQDVNNYEIEADAVVWYVVAIAILLALAAVIAAACVLFCLIKGKSFGGQYIVNGGSHTVTVGCY
jgi:hypothetical protein